MTGELLYKSFHSSAGNFRGYGTILLTDDFLIYKVLFKPEQVIKITLWNVLHVDCPNWVARQGFEVKCSRRINFLMSCVVVSGRR